MVTDVTLTYFWLPRIKRAFRLLFTGKFTISTDLVRYVLAAARQAEDDGENN